MRIGGRLRRCTWILPAVVFFLLLGSLPTRLFSDPRQPGGRDFHFVSGGRAEDVPFRMIDDHIYIPVTIRGETRLWIFDSGTNSNCVDLEYARRLGLVPEGELQARGASGKFAASFVTLPACSLPGIRFEAQKIPAFPMRGLFRRQAGLDVAGILGYDFISRFVARLDFSGSRLSFFDPDTFAYRGAGRVLAAPLHRNFLTVQVTVDGRYTGRFYLDSGSHKLEFHYPFAMQHGFLKRPGVDVMGSGAGGDSRDRAGRFRSIDVGGFRIDRPLLFWPLTRPDGSFGETEISGNLGNPLLKNFIVYFDYAHERVILEKGADFNRDFPEDHSGLQLACSETGDMIVFFVSPGTPAARAGFQKGDRIVAIDGAVPEKFAALPAIRQLLKGNPGTILRFRVGRRGKIRNAQLTLSDLFAAQ